ncbi:MAG: preprotein translocase subunit YajC [Candidatus Kuenenia stuttgartiensis]|nr:preprotein translocase subunit YajC [Candidatus Kuenenia stuttgartiensis]MCZ2444307.1 preprotein translocase subunit YajC [Flavobacteriales bacterium]
MNLLTILGMAGGQGGQGGGWEQMIPLVLIFVVFYFFMIRPQMRKTKEQKKYRESLAKGDKVVTVGGIHGKILDMEDNTIILEMIDKNRIKVEKSAISMESTIALSKENGK